MQQEWTRLHEDAGIRSAWRDRELWLHFSCLVCRYRRHGPRGINHQNRVYAQKLTLSIYGLAESVYFFWQNVYAQNLTTRSQYTGL